MNPKFIRLSPSISYPGRFIRYFSRFLKRLPIFSSYNIVTIQFKPCNTRYEYKTFLLIYAE